MSVSLPTRIFEPNPPVLEGQRKPTTARPNAVSPKLISVMMLRLRNRRRGTPTSSGSGGTHGASAPELALTTAPPGSRRSRATPFSTSRPVVAGAAGSTVRPSAARRLSRLRVSRLSSPTASPVSRRRATPAKSTTASTARTATPIPMMAPLLIASPCPLWSSSQVEEEPFPPGEGEVEARATEEHADHHQHGPEHEEHGHEGDRKLAVLGLVARVAVGVRRQHEREQADARDRHARDHRMEHREQLLEAQEVPRRLRRVRRAVDVGERLQRRVHEDRQEERERGHDE